MNTIELSDLISITMLSFFENLAEIFSKANVKINDTRNITEIFNVLVTLDQDNDNVKNAIKLLQDYPAAISLILSIPKEIDIVFRELCYDNYEKAREVSDNLVDVMKRDMVKDREQLINDESCCESDIDNESESFDFEFKPIDALFRIDDGVKFSINSGGTYSMCDSGMANPYRYTYGELMSTGCFSVYPPDIKSNEDICCDNPEDPIEEFDKSSLLEIISGENQKRKLIKYFHDKASDIEIAATNMFVMGNQDNAYNQLEISKSFRTIANYLDGVSG